jgi:hypothetical protein
MAPRAGFEVEHKCLSAHLVTSVGQLNIPARTPLPLSLEYAAQARAGAFAV